MKRLVHFVVFVVGVHLFNFSVVDEAARGCMLRPVNVAICETPEYIDFGGSSFGGPTIWHFAVTVVFIALSGLSLSESRISLKNTKWPDRRRLVLCIFWFFASIVFAVCAVILPMLYL